MDRFSNNLNSLPPFLKWAGGKRWLIPEIHKHVPDNYNHYYEPFVGSGAVFFSIRPPKATISDSNNDLIETYKAIQKDWRTVVRLLGRHHKRHCKGYYYEIRAKQYRTPLSRAARFIYLNRTCWNGLYRVNLNGVFNVPIGTKSNVILETDNFKGISNVLSHATILHSDFEQVIDQAQENDFVFIDPPYTVKHNKNGFIKYNEKLFSWDDQVRLKNAVYRAANRGVKILIMNACHESIENLYSLSGLKYEYLTRRNVLSGKAQYRGVYEELLIKCW